MAVDVGAIIAESVDRYYRTILSPEWIREHKARGHQLVSQFLSLTEAGESAMTAWADPKKRKDPEYRKGYKSGWKRKHDEEKQGVQGDGSPPGGHSGLYADGYMAGYQASGHAQNFLKHYNAGEHQKALDYAQQNIVYPHYGELTAHEAKISHTPEGAGFSQQMGNWMGLNLTGDEKEAPEHIHRLAKKFSEINSPENLSDTARHNVGGKKVDKNTGEVIIHGTHPADFGQAMVNMVKGAGKTQAGEERRRLGHLQQAAKRGQTLGRSASGVEGEAGAKHAGLSTVEKAVQQGEQPQQPTEQPTEQPAEQPQAAPAAPAASDVTGGQEPSTPEQAAAQQKLAEHIKTSLKPSLASSAFGAQAVAAHQAAGGDPNNPGFNPAIDEFMKTEHGADPHAAIEHAHKLWTNQLENWLRNAAENHPDPKVRRDLQAKVVPITAPIPGDPYGRHGYLRKDGGIDPMASNHPGDPSAVKYSAKKNGDLYQHETFDPVERLMAAIRDPHGFNVSRGGKRASWIPDTLREIPAFANLVTSRIEPSAIAQNKGLYDKARRENPQKVNRETGEPVESDKDYERRIKSIAHAEAESDPLHRKQLRPGSGSFTQTLSKARTHLHSAQNEHGDWLAHEGSLDASESENPMWGYNYGLGLRRKQQEAGEEPRHLVAKPVTGHPSLYGFGRRKGENPKMLGKRSLKPKEEGYVRMSAMADALNHMLEVFEQWVEENVDVPEGNMGIVMEDILARALTPTYGKLFEVAY